MRRHQQVLRNRSLLWAAGLFAVIGAVAWRQIEPLSFRSVAVESTTDQRRFEAAPERSVRDGTHGLEPLLRQLPKLPVGPTIERAEAIRSWVRNQQDDSRGTWMGEGDISSDDAVLLLERMRNGVSGSCRRMAYVMLGALQASGIDARVAVLSTNHGPGHSTVEAWLPEERRWILVDPSYDTLFLSAGGRALSGAEALDIWRNGGEVEFSRKTSRKPFPRHQFFATMRHLYVGQDSPAVDGSVVRGWSLRRTRFLHYHPGAPPYPEARKRASIVAAGISLTALLAISLVFLGRFAAWVLATPKGAQSVGRWPQNPVMPGLSRNQARVADDRA